MNLKNIITGKVDEAKQVITDKVADAKQAALDHTVEAVKSDWAKGKDTVAVLERRIAIAARNGEGETPNEPTSVAVPQPPKKPEPPVLGHQESFAQYHKDAPRSGWKVCSFREIKSGDWVRVSFTGSSDDVRYGVAHTFTDKNWWTTKDGHLLVGPAAIRSGRGQMATGTMVFNENMVLERIPAPVFPMEKKSVKEKIQDRIARLSHAYKAIKSTSEVPAKASA